MKPARFSRENACAILGVPPSALSEWEARGAPACDDRPDGRLTLSDLIALAVTREIARRLGPRLDDFAPGVKQLFPALAARADVERADDLSAVIGRQFAFVWRVPDGDIRCDAQDVVVVPLRPLLRELRDQVFP
jgi:hypothetical protein